MKTAGTAALAQVLLCEACARPGMVGAACTVDHIVPMSAGGPAYPSLDELASYCTPCHAIKTAADNGFVKGCDINGDPLNPHSDWYDRGASNHGNLAGADPASQSNTYLV